jgi:hypothetical protein
LQISKTTNDDKKPILALLAAGMLLTGGVFFAAPAKAFASIEDEDDDEIATETEVLYNNNDTDDNNDIEVFDSDGREYFGDDNDECEDFRNYGPGEYHLDDYICGRNPTVIVDDDDNDDDTTDNDGNPETWINWVKGNSLDDGSYVEIPEGAVVTSKHFKVDFQSDATDTGHGSHVDLKIDDDPYYAVASPQTFSIMSSGEHTIYLRGVDKYGNEDETPAKFTMIIRKEKTYPDDDSNRIDHKDIVKKIEDSENDVQDTVKDSEKDIKKKVEDSEDDVIFAIEKKLNKLEDNISEEHAVQDEELDDIQKDINKLRNGQQNLSDDVDERLDKLEQKLLKAMDANEKALKAKIEDSEGDVKRKVEDSEDDVIKQINALWDWLRDLVAEFAKALGLIAAEADEKKK